jgi:hypothetical protein
LDTQKGYTVEADIEKLIEKRGESLSESGQEARSRTWRESLERYNEREREANRLEWVRYFDGMAASHASISESYKERAERLRRGIDEEEN